MHSMSLQVAESYGSQGPESLLIIACTFSASLPQLADALEITFTSLISRILY
jgi:hypothetical protein